LKVSHSSGSSTEKRPHEKRGRSLIQNESGLLDTDLLPIHAAVEKPPVVCEAAPLVAPSSFALLHASVPQEQFSS
jgi:hypothetical protein